MRIAKYLVAGLLLFVTSMGLTYGIAQLVGRFSTKMISPISSPAPKIKPPKIDPAIPRTEACPINGVLYPKSYKEAWSTRRPLAVMIENHLDSRPLSGLSSADLVYEAIAEGGITRQMGIFMCDIAGQNITLAPVRSARIYFTKLVTEYDALYNHVGGAGNCDDPTVSEQAKALCFIRRNKIKDMDQFGLDFKSCHRLTNRLETEVAYEHTMACFTEELYKTAAKRDWQNDGEWDEFFTPWKFKDSSTGSEQVGNVTDIAFKFWNNKPDYDVAWKYSATDNTYARINGGTPVVDLNTDDPIKAKVVVVQFAKEFGPLDEHLHLDYQITGSGKAIFFQDGKATTGTWSKLSATARTKFMADGKEFMFNKGQIWVEIVPEGNIIEYNK